MEFNQNFLNVPADKRTAAYRESINKLQANLAEAKRMQQHYVSQSNVAMPTQAQVQPTAPEGKMTVEKLQGMYPGIPVDKLKAAYKQKFGEDL